MGLDLHQRRAAHPDALPSLSAGAVSLFLNGALDVVSCAESVALASLGAPNITHLPCRGLRCIVCSSQLLCPKATYR